MSWRRTTIGGAAAVAGLVIVVAVWMAMRAMGIGPAASLISSGKLGERERVILADFKSPATDSLLGPTVTEAFRTDLAQSKNLNVMPANNVRSVLQRMQRPTNVRVDYTVAREIATREGIKAVIDGEIVALGGSYVLSARLVAAQTGEELASFRETADAAKDIITAISRLSKGVRTRVGESLRNVQNARTLDKVTTPSLEALQRYVTATRAVEVDGDFNRFQELMNEAIALDTGFAMAYRKLAIELRNRGLQIERVDTLLQKAYDHRDRLSETERYITIGSYYTSGSKPDETKAIAAYESLLDIDPTNVTGLNNLSILYHDRRDYAKAEASARKAVEVQPTAAVFFNNVVHNQAHQGKFAEAAQTIALAAKNLPRHPDVVFQRTELAYEQRHFDSAAVVLDSLIASRSDDIPTRRDAEFERAQVAEIGGRLAESDRHMGQARTLARQLGNRQAAINAMLDSADQDSWYGIDPARALRTLDRTAATPLLDSLPPARRPYNRFVELYSRMGKSDKARAMLREAEALEQSKTAAGQRSLHAMRGMIARGERKYDEAIREFRASDGGGCNTCALPDLALAYDQAGNADSAIAVFARFTSGTGTAPGVLGTWLALSHRRLGELYDGKGDADNAMSHYAQFVDLWKNADTELQPQVAKARERLKELQRRKG